MCVVRREKRERNIFILTTASTFYRNAPAGNGTRDSDDRDEVNNGSRGRRAPEEKRDGFVG